MTSRDFMTSYSWHHNLQNRRIRKLGPGSTILVKAHTFVEHCVKNQLIRFRNMGEEVFGATYRKLEMRIIGTVAARCGRVGRLKLSRA